MTEKELMEVALKYLEKGYSYEQLMDGDDLYASTSGDRDICGDFYEEAKSIGTVAFEEKINKLSRKEECKKN